MSNRASATRYARALFDVALEESTPERAEQDLSTFAGLVAQHGELQQALASPAVPAQGKVGVVRELASRAGLSTPVSRLLALLAERDRLALLPDLVAVYRERLMEHQRVLRAEVTTAERMPADRLAQLEQRLAAATGRRVIVSTHVDPSLIAGIVTRIGSVVYDGSVATQLAAMKQRLMERA